MKIYVVYNKEGKCDGYFLHNEKHLAELYVKTYGGRFEEKEVK